jgi:hypothetical protein
MACIGNKMTGQFFWGLGFQALIFTLFLNPKQEESVELHEDEWLKVFATKFTFFCSLFFLFFLFFLFSFAGLSSSFSLDFLTNEPTGKPLRFDEEAFLQFELEQKTKSAAPMLLLFMFRRYEACASRQETVLPNLIHHFAKFFWSQDYFFLSRKKQNTAVWSQSISAVLSQLFLSEEQLLSSDNASLREIFASNNTKRSRRSNLSLHVFREHIRLAEVIRSRWACCKRGEKERKKERETVPFWLTQVEPISTSALPICGWKWAHVKRSAAQSRCCNSALLWTALGNR